MHTPMKKTTAFARGLLFPLAVSFALTACEAPKRAADYRDDYPLIVGQETVSLALVIPFNAKTFPSNERNRINVFANDFINRGKGQITIETGPNRDGGGLISSRIQHVQKALTNAGVSFQEIAFKTNSPTITGYGNVKLSFLARLFNSV